MPYSTGPFAPRARREAINLFIKHSYTMARLLETQVYTARPLANGSKRQRQFELHGIAFVSTSSAAAHTYPNALAPDIVDAKD